MNAESHALRNFGREILCLAIEIYNFVLLLVANQSLMTNPYIVGPPLLKTKDDKASITSAAILKVLHFAEIHIII